ncbi:hypothetical protein ACIRRA_44955 [Nocardia sp. NPDC101769]|uniref:hypothetical protein n=1 Tax=Nocardia sp. NPDC101769 TaxID=3364333 RepID=UPI003812B730
MRTRVGPEPNIIATSTHTSTKAAVPQAIGTDSSDTATDPTITVNPASKVSTVCCTRGPHRRSNSLDADVRISLITTNSTRATGPGSHDKPRPLELQTDR